MARYNYRELQSFRLDDSDRRLLNDVRRLCIDLRRRYDSYGGSIRDDVMVGAARVIEGVDELMNAQRSNRIGESVIRSNRRRLNESSLAGNKRYVVVKELYKLGSSGRPTAPLATYDHSPNTKVVDMAEFDNDKDACAYLTKYADKVMWYRNTATKSRYAGLLKAFEYAPDSHTYSFGRVYIRVDKI